jgi:hypothetical protein
LKRSSHSVDPVRSTGQTGILRRTFFFFLKTQQKKTIKKILTTFSPQVTPRVPLRQTLEAPGS